MILRWILMITMVCCTLTVRAQQTIVINRTFVYTPTVSGIAIEHLMMEWSGVGRLKQTGTQCSLFSTQTGAGTLSIYDTQRGEKRLKHQINFLFSPPPPFELAINGQFSGNTIPCNVFQSDYHLQLLESGSKTSSNIVSFDFTILNKRQDSSTIHVEGADFDDACRQMIRGGCGSRLEFHISNVVIQKSDTSIINPNISFSFKTQ